MSDPAFFRKRLKSWFRKEAREFPWRHTTNPYEVLMAEMMLRRTRAAQVVAVYERFLGAYPTPQALARAPAEHVADVLRPLGLRWRVPAFQKVAKEIIGSGTGAVPLNRARLLELPGVGDYVADAVLCFANSEPVAIVDTNTVRVAGRYFGFEFGPESRRNKWVREAISLLVDPRAARQGNFALLDFAATICRATRPLCGECPVEMACSWRMRRPLGRWAAKV